MVAEPHKEEIGGVHGVGEISKYIESLMNILRYSWFRGRQFSSQEFGKKCNLSFGQVSPLLINILILKCV